MMQQMRLIADDLLANKFVSILFDFISSRAVELDDANRSDVRTSIIGLITTMQLPPNILPIALFAALHLPPGTR